MPKLKSHKALLKRVKVTARGKIKFKRANTGHLRSHKSGNKLRQLRRKSVASSGDIGRLERMLHRPLTPGDR
jgi:large subunit ribosomal protein L35